MIFIDKPTFYKASQNTEFVNYFFFWWQVYNDCKYKHYSRILVVMLLNAIIMENVKFIYYIVVDYVKCAP